MTTAMMTAAGPFLIDTSLTELTLVEDRTRSGKHILRGLFGRVGVPTNNGRLYTEQVMRKNLNRLAEDIAKRGVFGELDHPADGRTKLSRVSHVITALSITEDGDIIGEAEILGTPAGNVLLALVKAGTRVGVSSRGIGTTSPGRDGSKLVNEDYRLMTFDVVAEPANHGAHPNFFVEGQEATPASVTRDQLRAAFPDMIREFECEAAAVVSQQKLLSESATTPDVSREQIEQELRGEFEARLSSELSRLKATHESTGARSDANSEDVHARFLAVTEANLALQAENEAFQEQTAAVEKLCKTLGYKYRLEQRLIGVEPELREDVREIVGDPTGFETLDELDEAFDEAVESVEEQVAEALAEAEALERAEAEMRAKVAEQAEPVVEELKKRRRSLAQKEQKLTEEAKKTVRGRRQSKKVVQEESEVLDSRRTQLDELRERLEGEIQRRQDGERRLRAKFNDHLEDLNEEVDRLREERDFYVAKAERQAELTEDLGAAAYAEKRLSRRSDAPRMRKILGKVRPRNRREVDDLLETVEEQPHSRRSEYDKVRRHARRNRRGRSLNEENETNEGGGQRVLKHSAVSMDNEMLRLAGVPGSESSDF